MKKPILALDTLIDPVSTRDFFEQYWEKKFLHVSRNETSLFADLFSLRDVDRWLMSVRSGLPDSVLLTSAGTGGSLSKFRPQDLSVDAAYDAFAKGSSVVLDYLEDSWPPLAPLVKSLSNSFSAIVGINVYITPPRARTFPVHIDDHDVLVLQVSGEKVWQLHELRHLPVMKLDYKKELAFTPDWGNDRLQTPQIAELTLQPGDLLYVPRGMPHCAVARDSTSLHLTISITPLYWTDFLKAAVEQASVHAPELRRALPPGFVGDEALCRAMGERFPAVMEAFQRHVSFDEALGVVRRKRVKAQGYPADGHFAHLEKLSEISLESAVERRDGLVCIADLSPYGFSNIRFGTRQVKAPANIYLAFEFVRDHPRFRVAEIPGLDDPGKLVLARRLVREGLLRFVHTVPHAVEREAVAQTA
jgi:ribosomal protein L16 Arg81 hydroxylase